MHVNTLTVLDCLPLKALLVGQLHDANGQLRQFRELRGTEAPCSCDDLVSFTVGTNGDGLDKSVGAKACCELGQLALIEDAAGVGGGLVDAGEGEVWNPALFFMMCPPWAGLRNLRWRLERDGLSRPALMREEIR